MIWIIYHIVYKLESVEDYVYLSLILELHLCLLFICGLILYTKFANQPLLFIVTTFL